MAICMGIDTHATYVQLFNAGSLPAACTHPLQVN